MADMQNWEHYFLWAAVAFIAISATQIARSIDLLREELEELRQTVTGEAK